MVRLTQEQIKAKKDFIKNYIKAANAADGSTLDANANVSHKNIATLAAEINKSTNVQVNRALLYDRITEMFGKELADEYIRQLETHEIYKHDETSLMPYCVSISLYPFLLNGLKDFGGDTKPPKHLSSFVGGLINLIFAVSSQFAGAVAVTETLLYFDYFARKDYGEDYLSTHNKEVTQELQSLIYAINQPAAARGFQSVFFNMSIYDKRYFDAMFGNFKFPDFTSPNWDTVNKLQKHFMEWINIERTKAILTFPVITAACLNNGHTLIDSDFQDFIADQYSKGNSFFTFTSDNAYALSSCCRLKNDIQSQINDFSYSLGAGGVATGSVGVMTINMNRLYQDGRNLKTEVEKIHKYQVAYRSIIQDYLDANMLPTFTAGYISLDKQYSTIGLNGIVEAAEFLGYTISNNKEYKDWVSSQLKIISDANKEASVKYGCRFNTEIVPAENVAVKLAKWDKADGYFVPRDCYNSYLYKVEDQEISVLDKFALHGRQTTQFLDGGSAYHCNLEGYPTKEGFKKLIDVAVKEGCDYFCFNILITGCNDCDNIDKRTLHECPKCHSKNIWHATRIIGYLKKISDFSSERQKEASKRAYAKISHEPKSA